jgi:predicted transcriptional regulator
MSNFAHLHYCVKQFVPKEATLRRNLLKTSAWRDLEAQADLQRQAGEKSSSKQVMFADVYSRAQGSEELMKECHIDFQAYKAERIEYFSALGRCLEQAYKADEASAKLLRPLREHVAAYEASDSILF